MNKTNLRLDNLSPDMRDDTAIFYESSLGNSSPPDNCNLPILLDGGGYKHAGHVAYDRTNH